MNFFRSKLKIKKKYLKILLAFVCLGAFVGFVFYKKIDSTFFIDDIQNISEYLKNGHINFLILHLIILSILISSSFVLLGILLFPLYFLWEIICISYSIFVFGGVFGISGVIFGVLYNLLLKWCWVMGLCFIFKNIFSIVKNIFIQKKVEISFKSQYQIILVAILGIFIYDILIYFGGSSILLKFGFLLT